MYQCNSCNNYHESLGLLAHTDDCNFWKAYIALDVWAGESYDYDKDSYQLATVLGSLRNLLSSIGVKDIRSPDEVH